MPALSTLEKVKCFEAYLAIEQPIIDPFIDRAMMKLARLEQARISALQRRLEDQIREFEQQYALTSAEFFSRYQQGLMGDQMDVIEWAATLDMLKALSPRLAILAQISSPKIFLAHEKIFHL